MMKLEKQLKDEKRLLHTEQSLRRLLKYQNTGREKRLR